jgi:hypothetical protein
VVAVAGVAAVAVVLLMGLHTPGGYQLRASRQSSCRQLNSGR